METSIYGKRQSHISYIHKHFSRKYCDSALFFILTFVNVTVGGMITEMLNEIVSVVSNGLFTLGDIDSETETDSASVHSGCQCRNW